MEALNARAHWIHVVPYDGAWTFKHEHGEPEGTFRTQKQAIEAAREHGRAHGDWELVIHGRNGTHPRCGRHPLKAEAGLSARQA